MYCCRPTNQTQTTEKGYEENIPQEWWNELERATTWYADREEDERYGDDADFQLEGEGGHGAANEQEGRRESVFNQIMEEFFY